MQVCIVLKPLLPHFCIKFVNRVILALISINSFHLILRIKDKTRAKITNTDLSMDTTKASVKEYLCLHYVSLSSKKTI